MEEFPTNSRAPLRPPAPVVEEKKVERVVSGAVVRRKKSWGHRLKEHVIGGDAQSVVGFMVGDVLVPALRGAIVEAFSGGLEKAIYGEVRGGSRGPSRDPRGYTAYDRYSSPTRRGPEPRREPAPRRRSSQQIDDVVLPNRVDADEVLDRMLYYVDKYERASVADLNELLGESSSHTDHKYGWVRGELDRVGVRRVQGGWLLAFPDPEALD